MIRFAVAAILIFLLTAPLWAQESRSTEPQRERITREIKGRTVTVERPIRLEMTEANFEKFRNDLRVILSTQKETSALLRLDLTDKIDSALRLVDTLKYSDYSGLKDGFVDMTLLRDAVTQQKESIAQALANNKARVAQYTASDPFPGAQYSLNLCPLNPQPPEVAFTSGIVTLAAELTRELALDVCNQIISALLAGGNTSLACIATDVVYAVIKGIDYPIQFCNEDTGAGEIKGGYLRAEHIKNDLKFSIANDNSNKAMLSTQITNMENHIVTNDNNNKAALSAQTAAFQTVSVRAAIERNLAADPSTTAAVSLFQMPAVRDGYLEVARQILIDTYNAQVAAAGAGVTVYNPSNDLSLGASFTSQGKFREAYYYYRKGYRSVVKYP